MDGGFEKRKIRIGFDIKGEVEILVPKGQTTKDFIWSVDKDWLAMYCADAIKPNVEGQLVWDNLYWEDPDEIIDLDFAGIGR